MEGQKFFVASSPHIQQKQTVSRIMTDVCIALMPATLHGIYIYGIQVLYVVLCSTASSVFFEFTLAKIFKKPATIFDGSAVVTGLLIGLCCPPAVPMWLPIAGSFFAIAIVKLPFGGLGCNFLNPALAARAFMLASWPQLMTTWQFPSTADAVTSATAVSQATSLVQMQQGTPSEYLDMLLGNMGGCIGEVSKIGILIGAAYLVIKRVIDLDIPISYLGTLFILTWALGGADGLFTGDGLYAILAGGVMLGACFMCNDYVTSPVTRKGQIVMGAGAGIITFLIRTYGNYPEGVTYAILFMNVCTPLIDKFMRPRLFGEVKGRA